MDIHFTSNTLQWFKSWAENVILCQNIFSRDYNLHDFIIMLADAGGRALGAIRTKLKYLKECGFNSFFNTLFRSGVLSITDYAAGVRGTRAFTKTEPVQYKGSRYFLEVHRFAPNDALLGDLGWVSSQTKHTFLF